MNAGPDDGAKDQQTAWLRAGRGRRGKPVWRQPAAGLPAGTPRRGCRPAAPGRLRGFAVAAAACALAGAGAWQAQSRHARADVIVVAGAADEPNERGVVQQPGTSQTPDKEELFSICDTGVAENCPKNPSTWTLREPVLLTYIRTYHYNNLRGVEPGMISLRHEDGAVYGPWQTKGMQEGVMKNIAWEVRLRVVLRPGTYTVVDSDPPTWSQNAGTGHRGYVNILFRRLGGALAAASPLANGLVALWAADGDARDGAGDNHGQIKEGVTFAEGKFGQAFKLDGDSGHVDFGNPRPLQLTGSMTISLWIRPDNVGQRQNVLHKAYGGEMDITMHNDGQLVYHFGQAGNDGVPYGLLFTGGLAGTRDGRTDPVVNADTQADIAMMKPGQWAHVVIVREVKADATVELTWYVNGKRTAHAAVREMGIRASGQPLLLGKGHQANFAGLIDDVGIWDRPLSAEEVRLLHQAPGLRHAMTASGTMAVAPAATRVAGSDRVLAKDGTVLLGTLENQSFTLATAFGKMEIAAKDLAGIVPAEGAPGKVWLLLADEQAIRGELADPVLSLKLAWGSTLRIPLKEVRECGLRATDQKPASRIETTAAPANPMMIVLRSGERLACADLKEDVTLETPYGPVAAPAKALLRIEPSYDRLLCYRLVMRSGSQLSGTLRQEKLAVKLRLGPEAAITRQDFVSLYRAGEAAETGDQAVTRLRSGDVLVGEVADKTLTLRTRFGSVQFAPANALDIRFDPAGGARAAVRLWNASILSGELVEPAVTFTAWADGPALKLPVGQVASIVRSTVLPPAEIVQKVRKLITQLGAESYKDRQAATDSLVEMGPPIIPLLEKHMDAPDPEVRARVATILEKLRPEAKEAPAH